jgi:hypothetical protein
MGKALYVTRMNRIWLFAVTGRANVKNVDEVTSFPARGRTVHKVALTSIQILVGGDAALSRPKRVPDISVMTVLKRLYPSSPTRSPTRSYP